MSTKKYNVFLLLSNMARNIVDIFSLIILYNKNYSLQEIFIYLSIYYFSSIFVNIFSLKFLNKHNYKILLIISSIFLGLSFYYLSSLKHNLLSLTILALLLSISNYTYHSTRHYLGLKYLNNRSQVSLSLIYTYLGLMLSSYLGSYLTSNYSLTLTTILVIILSILSIIPILNLQTTPPQEQIFFTTKLNNPLFVILEQFKVIFLLLEPLYLYININSNLNYISLFNILIGLSSLLFTYYLGKISNPSKLFKYLNISFVIVLLFKLILTNKVLLYLIAFLEGIGIKNFEVSSLENFYHSPSDIPILSYRLSSEVIFCLTCFLIAFLSIFLNNLLITMFFFLIAIFIASFVRYPKTK